VLPGGEQLVTCNLECAALTVAQFQADYVVLAKDPMKVRASAISETTVLRTVVGGRTVYRAR
jgi:hypothetical protein